MDTPSVKITKKKDRTLVAINGAMTIGQAAELRDGLLQAFGMGKRVELSLEGVTEVDITGLQLLCSSHRTSTAKELEFCVTGADGERFSSVALLAGMQRHTGCAQDSAGTCVWKKEFSK